ncbi:MAG: sulfotransferase family 2 domain-containing protein [Desulfosarcina sp.]|nr:sulfotransferase family 2 domain-containing protein [Desulfosarcina sp.]MBC2764914.1 sulfotransferase family 2 domain-containing protein [Desulfosarcina sp.]
MIGKLIVFVHIEKCGGTTLIDVLRRSFGCNHVDMIPGSKRAMLIDQTDFDRLVRLRPAVCSIAGHSLRPYLELCGGGRDLQYYTLLRDPIRRYISDFKYFVDVLGYPPDFNTWLAREDRRNFQVKALAGVDDVSLSKRILAERFSLFGFVEKYDLFFGHLRTLSLPYWLTPDFSVKNSTDDRSVRNSTEVDFERYAEAIEEANLKDIELYAFAQNLAKKRGWLAEPAGQMIKGSDHSRRLFERYNLVLNRLYRGLVYKPYVGRLPFLPHALPVYKVYRGK